MKIKAGILLFVLLSFVFTSFVMARDGNEDSNSSNDTTESLRNNSPHPSETPEIKTNEIKDSSETGEVKNETGKLSQLRLRSCEARQETIKEKQGKLMELSANISGKFDGIFNRVNDYYKNTLFPSGKTLSNYNELLSDIDAKKIDVTNAINKAQSDMSGFSCTSNDPKGLLDQFRLDMQDVKKALEAYRISIKNFIVSVRTIANDNENTASPSPIATP